MESENELKFAYSNISDYPYSFSHIGCLLTQIKRCVKAALH